MTTTVSDMVDIMESIAPPSLAEEWDNVGLQIGNPDWDIKKVWIALDPIKMVIAEACSSGVDMLITHHPMFIKPLYGIDLKTPLGASLELAIKNRLAIFAAHTNLDSAEDGLNDVLAKQIGLSNTTPLVPAAAEPKGISQTGNGIGRIGDLANPISLKDFAANIKEKMGLPSVDVVGAFNMDIHKVAICTGSGSSLVDKFLASDAQVFISGDLRYHDAQDVLSAGRGIVDIGHFYSEHIIVDHLARRIKSMAHKRRMDVIVEAYKFEKDPFRRM